MTCAPPRPARPAHRLSAVALLTALAFGCTTIRTPVAVMAGGIPIRDGSAEPQLALWLESAEPVKPEEATRARARVRAALEEALAGRQVGDGSTVLVVREQGVVRTASHRSDQVAATVGLVAGAVVVVVGLVVLLASGKGGGHRDGTAPARAAAPGHGFGVAGTRPPAVSPALPLAAAARPPPGPRPGSIRPPPGQAPGSTRPPPQPGPFRDPGHGPSVGVAVGVELQPVPLGWHDSGEAVVLSSRELAGGEAPDGSTGQPEAPGSGGAAAGPEAPAPPASQARLPPMAPPSFEERGFFAGDLLVLELTLVDRLTGEPRWTKWVEEEVDPCDARAVRQVLDRAFAEASGWQPAP